MKKIFSIIIPIFIVAIIFSGCNNKPPFVRLAAAIDSVNMQNTELTGSDEKLISYDKWENQLKYHINYPGHVESDVFEPIAEHFKQLFLIQLISENPFGLATEILDAKADVVLEIKGERGGSYEVLITTDEIKEASDAFNATPEVADEQAEPAADDEASLPEEQRELMEGNVTTVE